jgi:uncharacterized membrane protein
MTALLWGTWGYIELRGVRTSSPLGFNVVVSVVVIVMNMVVGPVTYMFARNLGHKIVWSRGVWLLALAASVLCEIAAVTYLFALRDGKPARVIVVASTYPLVSVLLCWLIGGERLSFKEWAGVVLVVLGLVLVVRE